MDVKFVDVLQDQKIGVYENDLVVIGELPHAELAVVPLVVGTLLGEGAEDAFDALDLPSGGSQAPKGGGSDGVVGEEDQVTGGVGADDALGQGDCSANIGF